MISGLYQIVWIHGSVLILCSCPGKDQHFCFLFGHLLSLTKIAVRIADIQIVPNHDQNLIFPLDLPSISRDFYVSLSCWCLYITISFSVCQLFSENLSVFLLLSVMQFLLFPNAVSLHSVSNVLHLYEQLECFTGKYSGAFGDGRFDIGLLCYTSQIWNRFGYA